MIAISNLHCNMDIIISALQADSSSIVVSWLPQYHDMGLIGSSLCLLYISLSQCFVLFQLCSNIVPLCSIESPLCEILFTILTLLLCSLYAPFVFH